MNKFKLKYFLASLIVLGLFLNANFVSARGLVPCGGYEEDGVTLEPVCTMCHLIVGMYGIVEWIRNITIFVALFVITLAGVMWIVSAGGDLAKMAKNAITNTVIGVVIMLSAWLIIVFILSLISYKEGDNEQKDDTNPNKLIKTGAWEFSCSTKSFIEGEKIDDEGEIDNNSDDEEENKLMAKCGTNSSKVIKGFPNTEDFCKVGSIEGEPYKEDGRWTWECLNEVRDNFRTRVTCHSLVEGDDTSNDENIDDYSFDSGIKKQTSDASDKLKGLLNCMSEKLPSGAKNISSISDGNGGASCYDDHPTWSQCTKTKTTNCCFHTKNSCHYGGINCKGESYAVDINRLGYSSEIVKAAKECGGSALKESTHVHVSIGSQSGCGCDTNL